MKTIAIISAFQAGQTLPANMENSTRLKTALLARFPAHAIETVTGVYKGSREIAFMIALAEDERYSDDVAFICELQKHFKQETVLHRDSSDGKAHLIYQDGHHKYIGYLRHVPKSLAKSRDNYTLINKRGLYFIADKTDTVGWRSLLNPNPIRAFGV